MTRKESREDAISRQATIDAIYKKHIGGKDAIENAPINDLYACGLEEAIDAVDNMPPVALQPKIGHWIELGYLENDNYDFECSVCHHTDTHSKTVKVNYCWNCGAKMECEVEE